ncbi:MAG: hypothetical protein L6R41_000515 [Letrouitia leprolyta]|nr:MAG: hypothetical protein L6R41_000515 [Letrouitia leprolyta]
MRKSSFRGVVDVVFGGVKEEKKEGGNEEKEKNNAKQSRKRKAEDDDRGEEVEKPLSKREMKRRAKKARMERALEVDDEEDKITGTSVEANTGARLVGGAGSVTITEGNTPDWDVIVVATSVATGIIDEDIITVLSSEIDPLEDDTATLFATLAEVTVWKVDI